MELTDYAGQLKEYALHPTVQGFCQKELDLLNKDYLDLFSKSHPKLDKVIQDCQLRLLNPRVDLIGIHLNRDMLKVFYHDKLQLKNHLENIANENDCSHLLQEDPALNDMYSIIKETSEIINDLEKKLSSYVSFVMDVSKAIQSKVENHCLWLPDSSILFEKVSDRDAIFSKVLPSDSKWMVGFGIYTLPRIIAVTQRDFDNKTRLYNSVKDLIFEGTPVPEKEIVMSLPPGLGDINVSAQTIFEGLAPQFAPYTEYKELYTGLKNYFTIRADRIFQHE